MKKSEAVVKVNDWINKMANDKDFDMLPELEQVNNLLDWLIENNILVPPARAMGNNVYVNEWESEDE